MTDFAWFLGRFHVLALHLPIGMLLLTLLVDVASRRARHQQLAAVLPLCWGATAVTALLTLVLGMMHASEPGFDTAAVAQHRNYGVALTLLCFVLWLLVTLHPQRYRQLRTPAALVLLVLVTMTGHYGGNLTHGSTYLVEHAPPALRELAGLPQRRPAPASVAAADPWHDVIQPLLQARCSNCHNPDKQRGGLDLSTLELLLLGGENGVVVVAGERDQSDLLRRVSLPQQHDDFMPEGKQPLSDSQIALLGWWIDAGLPADRTLAELDLPQDIAAMFAGELGLAPAAAAAREMPVAALVTPEQTAALESAGWLLRARSLQDARLIVSLAAPRSPATPAMLQALADVATVIVELDLSAAGIDDAALQTLAAMPELEVLKLGDNALTDTGVAALQGCAALQVLHLLGNAGVTDAALAELAPLQQLHTLHAWGTGITPDGAAALAATRPGLRVEGLGVTP